MTRTVSLRHYADVNPRTNEFKEVAEGESLAFLPLENIWPSGSADYSQTKAWKNTDTSYTQFRRGDILVPKVTPTVFHGRSMIAETETEVGLATSEVHVLRPKNGADARWITYNLLSSQFLDRARGAVHGVGGLQRISSSYLGSYKVVETGIPNQKRIADYLDRETAEIDAAVADLDRYVELLEKRRRRIIIQGFNDPHYESALQRLKFLTTSEDHRRLPIKSGDRAETAGEYPYYGASGIIDYVNNYLWDEEERLLLSEDGANLVMRNHPIAFVANGQYWVNNHAHVLKCLGDTPPELVAMAIEISSVAHLITGSAQPKLTAAAMGEIEFLFPLEVEDQKALLVHLNRETTEIDSLISESKKLRNLLLKRRSVLITEVVTGRKKV